MANFHELISGFHHFKQTHLLKEQEFFEALKHRQNPKTLVVACCDSRVDPAIILGCRPGDLFVVRNVAAMVPAVDEAAASDAVMSAVEYGVKHLAVEHIIVMGHSNCGGIHALLHPHKVAGEAYIEGWLKLAAPVAAELERERLHDGAMDELDMHRRGEEGAVLLSIENLLSYDWIEQRVQDNRLSLHALYYDMHEGRLNIWDAAREDFVCSSTLAGTGK